MNILTINAGSSSIKASLFSDDGRKDFRYTNVSDQKDAFKQLMSDLNGEKVDIVGHRFVHGGDATESARLVTPEEYDRLNNILHLAPLHMPSNILGLELCRTMFDVPQIACFDTAFHRKMPELSKRVPIPTYLGFEKFGFHGLSYSYIASQLPNWLDENSRKKVVVAHLGSGSSLCLMENCKSVDTTMGYTPAGGIPMGTRSGDIDPGIMIELAKDNTPRQLRNIIFKMSGLKALSNGESDDMQKLLMSYTDDAKFAVDYFCREVRGAIGSLAAKAGGIDALVFTGGIGENSQIIRDKISKPLYHFLVSEVIVIPTDEELMIRNLCVALNSILN